MQQRCKKDLSIISDPTANKRTSVRNTKISIIMPVYNTDIRWLKAALDSVYNQYYSYWNLFIVDDGSTRQETLNYLHQIIDQRIETLFLPDNRGIASASNAALARVTSEFVCFLDHDDQLKPEALQEIAEIINQSNPDIIYSDEEYIKPNGAHYSAHFKPDYSPDLLLATNYICHLTAYRYSLIHQVGGLREGYDGAQDYDLLLRCLERTNKISHIPKILYQWRRIPGSTASHFSNKHYAWEVGRLVVANALKRRCIFGSVSFGKHPGTYRVQRTIHNNPTVSIIIPFRDLSEILKRCIDSILNKTEYPFFEIIGVSNQSQEPATFALMAEYKKNPQVIFIHYEHDFNFSAINNFAVNLAQGKHILLLNNDTEVINPGWLAALLENSQRPEVGAVGAKLYYPNHRIQHAGVIVGIGGSAGHAHKCLDWEDPGYFNRLDVIQNVSAVTGACLMVKKEIYKALGGLDPINLPISFNDIDFCLRIRELGYLNVFTPYCELYHYESRSRRFDKTSIRKQQFYREREYLRARHSAIFKNGDPYYNPNLPLNCETFGLRWRYLRPLAFELRNSWQTHHSLAKAIGVIGRSLLKIAYHART